MRVGREPPRQWVEGRTVLFDDSFEHEVWNDTPSPRLILCVDMWHPALDTEEKRLATLDPPRAARYVRLLQQNADFERADRADAVPARTSAAHTSDDSFSPVVQLIVDTREATLGGATGVRSLLGCLASARELPVAMPVPASPLAATERGNVLPVAVPIIGAAPSIAISTGLQASAQSLPHPQRKTRSSDSESDFESESASPSSDVALRVLLDEVLAAMDVG